MVGTMVELPALLARAHRRPHTTAAAVRAPLVRAPPRTLAALVAHELERLLAR